MDINNFYNYLLKNAQLIRGKDETKICLLALLFAPPSTTSLPDFINSTSLKKKILPLLHPTKLQLFLLPKERFSS